MPQHEVLELLNFPLRCGITLPAARLVYATHGTLNAEKSNAILYPTSYGAQHPDLEWLIGPDRILDPTRYFIICVNQFGNGLSTSPSNLAAPYGPGGSPSFHHLDNIRAQERLLTEVFGIGKLALAYGWSMGAQQALYWGALYPERVARIAAICGSAKTSPHNVVFLEGLKATLTCDPAWAGDHFVTHPERGLRAFARVYAGWALSQEYYRNHLYQELGYTSLDDYLIRDWEAAFLKRDAHNLLSMLNTWLNSDISDNDIYHGDLPRALSAILAATLLMPGASDLYFTETDCRLEAAHIPHVTVKPIVSPWGHRSGNPVRSPADTQFIKTAIADLLSAE